MTVSDGGELGNVISKYASLYAYSQLLQNVSMPVIPKQIHRSLKTKVFPHITIKTYNSENCDGMFGWINGSTKQALEINIKSFKKEYGNNQEQDSSKR